MGDSVLMQQINSVRRFNRFYTKQIGILNQSLYGSLFSLIEVRVLYELAHNQNLTASKIIESLHIDAGYLSRIIQNLSKQGLITRQISVEDKRLSYLSLTKKGERVFKTLNEKSEMEVSDLLTQISETNRTQLIKAMEIIENLLSGESEEATNPSLPYLLRNHQPGDMGWITYRHGALYSQEYGYDETFEALVADICAKFIQNFDPKLERCWIAERNGSIVGSIMLVKKTKTIAQLRLLLIEPSARGLGIGSRLIEECTRFARQAGFKKIMLWTQSDLHNARRLYKKAGYKLTDEKSHHSFGKGLVAETWELDLRN